MADPKIKFDLLGTYIATIKNSVGTRMFQNIYIIKNGRSIDVANGGEFSCAIFVSSVLVMSDNLIKSSHATVKRTQKDIQESGWYKIKKPRKGAIIVWPPWEKSDHWHIGFCIGKNKAISNDGLDTKTPQEHPITYGKYKRKIDSIWWNDRLNK